MPIKCDLRRVYLFGIFESSEINENERNPEAKNENKFNISRS